MMELRDPGLYAPSGEGDGAVLLAMRDPATGAIAFPRTPYAVGMEEVVLRGEGELLVCVTIHQPLSPGMSVPRLVARLRLDEGPVIDGVVEAAAEPPPGTRLRAVLLPEGETMACRFRPVAA